ncbi:hypothetical protein ACH4E7_32010 [Kitasatospora sp. NPDC018058]|uniref:hypothetical protein n=1 Tax=Kitasatospora sp. NPDC018058 TaxID=3364025 RepID=UPI0037BF6F2B
MTDEPDRHSHKLTTPDQPARGGDTTTHTATDRVIRGTPPSLTISKTHTGNFTQGRQGTYTITVGTDGNGPTDGTTVTMHDTPAGADRGRHQRPRVDL